MNAEAIHDDFIGRKLTKGQAACLLVRIKQAEQAAFEEGQREMRERAANSIKGTLTFLSCSHDGHGLEKIIRALPLTPRGGEI